VTAYDPANPFSDGWTSQKAYNYADYTAQTASNPIGHGSQIFSTNVGYTAYRDPTLGRYLTLADLTVTPGVVSASDLVTTGGTIKNRHFTGNLIVNVNNITVVGCLFDNPVTGTYAGLTATGWNMSWCTVNSLAVGSSAALGFSDFVAYRCYVAGCVDGIWPGGNSHISECYVRVAQQSPTDHNDAIQFSGAAGMTTIEKCNLDCRPVNASGGNVGDSAIIIGDLETGYYRVYDNLLAGGTYAIRTYDSGIFDVQGNYFVDGSYTNGAALSGGATYSPNNNTWGTVRVNRLYTAKTTVVKP
jgi:hypothetical protein